MEELNGIVERMVAAGESEQAIRSVIESFNASSTEAKTNDSAVADPNVESEKNTGSKLANGSSEPRDASDFSSTQEKNIWLEDYFGKNELTDFVGDLYRAFDQGTEAGASVDAAFDIYKGKGATDEEVKNFLQKTRNIEEKGQTDEMIALSEKQAQLKKEGYNGVSAFFLSWWDNPSAMLQYTVSSMSQMGRALESEEVLGSAAASAGAGAAGGATGGAVFAGVGAIPGAIIGSGAGFFGGLSGAMETAMTTASLLQEEAIKDGLNWAEMSDKQRFNYVRKVQNDTKRFDDIKSNALARGITIGAIDGIVGGLTGGIGGAVEKAVSTGARSALTGVAKTAAAATVETVGGIAGEFAGQKAAGQDYNLEEALIEGFADKTFTSVSLAKSLAKGNPKYSLNGQKMNGKEMSDALKMMSDEAYVKADIKIDNSPAVQKLVDNRRMNISADQRVDSRINDVADRAQAIKLTKELEVLKGNKEGNKTKIKQTEDLLNNISEKYKDSEVDATIEQRQKSIAEAVDNKFEKSFNKFTEAAKEAAEKLDFKDGPQVFDATTDYVSEISKVMGISLEAAAKISKDTDGAFLGKGVMLIDKQRAKEVGAVSVGTHELLHPVLNALVGGVKTQGQFVQDFKKSMTKSQISYVEKALKANVDPENWNTEYINYFSDGILKNEITYDKTLFEKLGDIIVKLFKGQGFDNISFDNGKDVYNFLKEYNTSIKESGSVSDKAISAIKKAEVKKKTKVSEVGLVGNIQASKQLTPEATETVSNQIMKIKSIATENEALAKKYGKEPIKSPVQSRLEGKVLAAIKPVVDRIVTNRTKALYDPIAADAKKLVTREEFMQSMRIDIETMTLNEYDKTKQELEKFIVSRSYLRANNLAKRLGIESQEEGGIKSDVDSAKNITATKDEQSVDRSGNVERGQATFDQLEIVDDSLIDGLKAEINAEFRMRARKGTLSESAIKKADRKEYSISWVEEFIDKKLFKRLLSKWGAIGESKGQTKIPGTYIDFLNDKASFDIIMKALPIKSIKKSYDKLFNIERIGRELSAEGNPTYKIAPITQKTFLQYFLDGKKSTILERQKQLAREILRPVVKNLIAEYATTENLSKLEEIKKLAPEDSVDAINSIKLEAEFGRIESEIDRYESEKSGFDVIQFSKGLRTSFGLKKSDVNFTDIKQIEAGRKGLISVFKKLKAEGFTSGEIANIFIGTARGSWGLLGGSKYAVGKDNVLVEIKDIGNEKKRYQRFLMTGAMDFFNLLNEVFPETKYKARSSSFKEGGKIYDLDKVPSQGTKGFASRSMFNGKSSANATVEQRNIYALKQRSNLKTLVDTLSIMYKANELTANQTAMILGTLGSSTNGLIRTAAKLIGYSEQGLSIELKSDYTNFRFEHAQPASATIVELSKLITDKNYPHSFDQIMEGFNVYIIPKTYDSAISSVFNSEIPLDKDGYMILSTELKSARYTHPKVKAAIEKLGLKPLVLKSLQASKSQSSTGKLQVYHGGEIKSAKDIKGYFIYFSDDKKQAQYYADGNYGEVKKVTLNQSDIVPESDVFEVIKNLNIKPKAEGWTVADSRLYELIDDRFENSFAKEDLNKLKEGLEKENIKAARFTDSDMNSGRDIENIVVFDKSIIQFSANINKDFNNIIEGTTNIDSKSTVSEAKSRMLGKNKGEWKFFIPPSADDFAGLMYKLLGKGKEGDANAKWFKDNLFDPFAKGITNFEAYKQQAAAQVKVLKKSIKNVPKGLGKTNKTGFTNDVAVRVYLWAKRGYDIQGLDAKDQKELIQVINESPKLKDFALQLDSVLGGYPEPQNNWLAGTVTTDAINMVNTTKRAEFLQEYQANADEAFSKENINKLRAAYGEAYVEALQDMLYRMKSGRNRPSGSNKLTNTFMNWVNDSVGTIMFFNTRSALLQTLSIANFINWGDNNPVKAAAAFANQKQFWSDFAMLFNSDFLKQRRSGLKTDVNADDIASAAESATNKSKAVLASLLKAGFLPTQMADSFAIAMGGASFIRNRINKYIKEGLNKKEAEQKAFLDFQEVAEETQQSSRPDRISQQQASPLGRIILAFANTPMQYMRLTKKAILDIKNGRGDFKTNLSKIVYYTAVQNIIFSALQTALFAGLFSDEDDETVNAKESRIANGMLDTILRGLGVGGAIVSTVKNVGMEIKKQSEKGRPDYTQAAIRTIDLSPPVSSKLRKLMSAGRAFSYKKIREKMTGFGLDNPAYYAGGQIVSAVTNIPLDRVIKKADNIRVASDNQTKLWQKVALMFGYSQWDLGLQETTKAKGKSKWGSTTTWKKSGWKTKEWKK